jgi:hypothetical protein
VRSICRSTVDADQHHKAPARTFRRRERPRRLNFRLPIIALELVEDEEQVEEIKVKCSSRKIKGDLCFDLFAIIPIYTVLFVALGYWLFWRDVPYARLLGVAVGLCAVGAALLDIVLGNFIPLS